MATSTVTSHAIRERGTPVLWARVTTSPQSPQSAPSYLESLSGDIRAAVLLDSEGEPVAHAGAGEPEEIGELVAEVLARVDDAAGERAEEIEVLTGSGTVFAVR